MQIHMVIKSEKIFCETVTQNIKPFVFKDSADRYAEAENNKLNQAQNGCDVDFYVVSYDVEEGDA